MELLQALATSLLSPMVLAFALGIVAKLIRSDLKISDEFYTALTIYLLFAIGLKGGMKLESAGLAVVWKPILAAIFLSVCTPIWSYVLLRKACGLDNMNAGAIAAHYGSVSAVTFSAALAFIEKQQLQGEACLPALLAIMEVPAIIVATFLAKRAEPSGPGGGDGFNRVLHELLTSKGILLLLGGLVIGYLGGHAGYEQVAPLFDAPFKGVLTLFLLSVGLMTGARLADLKALGPKLVLFALLMPPLHALVGVLLAAAAGMSLGGATVLATLAASASYIAAPAAVRVALPAASPALYFTTALGITFPFNILVGIPLYHEMARFFINA